MFKKLSTKIIYKNRELEKLKNIEREKLSEKQRKRKSVIVICYMLYVIRHIRYIRYGIYVKVIYKNRELEKLKNIERGKVKRETTKEKECNIRNA